MARIKAVATKMAKMEKKSVSELLSMKPKKPSLEQIEQITQDIHAQKQVLAQQEATDRVVVEPKIAAKPTVVRQTVEQDMDDLSDRFKRISVHAPLPIYIKAKTKSTIQGVSMMAYILRLMENDLAN